MTWAQRGFVGLYPDLIWIFHEKAVLAYFESEIVPNHSLTYRRCRALVEINTYLHGILRQNPHFTSADGWAAMADIDSKPDKASPEDRPYVEAIRTLGILMLCHNYAEIYLDMLEIYRRFGVNS